MAQKITVELTCDEPGHEKTCGKDAGPVAERRYVWGGKEFSTDRCETSWKNLTVAIQDLVIRIITPAISQKRVIVIDDQDYRVMATKWWVNLPEYKEKWGHPAGTRGVFPKEKIEALCNAHSVWETWTIGDPIPEEWRFDPGVEEVTFVGVGKP
jgi:hypothetical protein